MFHTPVRHRLNNSYPGPNAPSRVCRVKNEPPLKSSLFVCVSVCLRPCDCVCVCVWVCVRVYVIVGLSAWGVFCTKTYKYSCKTSKRSATENSCQLGVSSKEVVNAWRYQVSHIHTNTQTQSHTFTHSQTVSRKIRHNQRLGCPVCPMISKKVSNNFVPFFHRAKSCQKYRKKISSQTEVIYLVPQAALIWPPPNIRIFGTSPNILYDIPIDAKC